MYFAGKICALGIALGACSLACGRAVASEDSSAFRQRSALELEAYLGLWHEIGRTHNKYQDNTPEKDGVTFGPCTASTAEYAREDEGTLSVTNRCVRKAPSGPAWTESISGQAKSRGDALGRQWAVAFGSGVGRFFMRLFTGGGADYWIYGVGPKGPDGRYTWALVSGGKKNFLYFLARGSQVAPEAVAEAQGLALAEGLPWNALVMDSSR